MYTATNIESKSDTLYHNHNFGGFKFMTMIYNVGFRLCVGFGYAYLNWNCSNKLHEEKGHFFKNISFFIIATNTITIIISTWDRWVLSGLQWESKSKHHKDTCSKEIGLRLQISITTLHSIVNKIGRTYVSDYQVNKHALQTTISKPREVQSSNWFLQMFRCKFPTVKQVPLCKSNR